MLVLSGSSALTVAKRAVLLKGIQAACPAVTSVDAIWLHLVSCTSKEKEEELSDVESAPCRALNSLLSYGDDDQLRGTLGRFRQGENVVYVVPRPGSISPWSSKATDIARICGLGDHIDRLERGSAYVFELSTGSLSADDLAKFTDLIHDRMTQSAGLSLPQEALLFSHHAPRPLRTVELRAQSKDAARQTLETANKELGLALASDELDYLVDAYTAHVGHDPTDAELFMFAQVNSEHCRHKIFNASWTIDGAPKDASLFQMIRNTEKAIGSANTISAYSDNAAVLQGQAAIHHFRAQSHDPAREPVWALAPAPEDSPMLIKVETHNHPTAVSPYPGAATGSGGEIRDEGATGRGSEPKAGLAGFTVSNLRIPGFAQPWEARDVGKPAHIASALDIMLEAPLGASAFNNEFGRPALAGYFRTFEVEVAPGDVRGYHKPIMVAGGFGTVRPQHAQKGKIRPGARLVVLGGPGMLIGLGGGAASSQASGAGSADLDFASVQRDNAEMQRRCQQVIAACVAAGEANPIASIHDVGAGGLSNALPELVHDAGLGAVFEVRDVPVADSSLSPMEIWCNESQERYVLALEPDGVDAFERVARRERCPYALVGTATAAEELVVTDRLLKQDVVRLPMSTLFGKPPKMSRTDATLAPPLRAFDPSLAAHLPSGASLTDRLTLAADRVLRLPSVASKSFLITIGDRSITGLVARDQMVGPWQVPVADVAVTRASHDFAARSGEAMAMGERTPLAVASAPASARMAVAEALANLAAAAVALPRTKLSANWMCAAGRAGEGAALYAAVRAVGMELCPALGVGIPVGKDSMSMAMRWEGEEGGARVQREVASPLSLIVTAFAPVRDVRDTWTPVLRADVGETVLVLVDVAGGKQRLGGSALAQVFGTVGTDTPDVDDAAVLKAFLDGCQRVRRERPELVLAYHDRSDGGLFTTLAEMAFAGRVGVDVRIDALGGDAVSALFTEELGAVFQVRKGDGDAFAAVFASAGVPRSSIHVVGKVNVSNEDFVIRLGEEVIYSSTRADLQTAWAETSFRMQSLRDNPDCAAQEHALIAKSEHRGLSYHLPFTLLPLQPLIPSPTAPISPPRPRVAIIREQGINGHAELAFAFAAAGFDPLDVHMTDLLSGTATLADVRGLAFPGGFSYGDVLGAGRGWAASALRSPRARAALARVLADPRCFALGICNGCQLLSALRELVPGAAGWPAFRANASGRFEGRVCAVAVDARAAERSVFLRGMGGARLPVAVAHGEGRAVFAGARDGAAQAAAAAAFAASAQVALRYVDSDGRPTAAYPLNPNGSPLGITGVQTPDGRVLALMPHPERVTAMVGNSWAPEELKETWDGPGPWFRMFQNARAWVDEN
ncbi:CobB/CobQ-like glutamine amidotransferase domain-containing protein [Schizophyllum fasciatum]